MSTNRSPASSLRHDSGDSVGMLAEITELPEEDDDETPPKIQPRTASVNLDGVDWFLTMLVITVDALLLELHRTGETKWVSLLTWVTNPDFEADWVGKVCETLFLLAVAVVNVLVVIPIVNINIRTPTTSAWRFWLLSAWASLALLNIMTAVQCVESVIKALDDEGVKYWISHFFLVGMVVVSTLLLDLRFVMLYGCFTCMTCDEAWTLEEWNGLRAIGGKQMKLDRARLRDILHVRRIANRTMYTNVRPDWHKGVGEMTFKFVETTQQGVQRFIRRRRLQKLRHLLSHRMTEQITDMPSEDVGDYLNDIMRSQSSYYFSVVSQRIQGWWDSIAEEPGFFEYSSWMKAAMSITILIVVYNCIKAMEMIFALDAVWNVGHNAAHVLESELDGMNRAAGSVRSSIDEISSLSQEAQISQTWSSVHSSLTSQVQSLDDSLAAFHPDGISESSSYQRAGSMMHLVLIRASRITQRGNFDGEKVISAFFYVDSLIRWLKYACIAGYPLGTCIGFYSLYQVMKQHKEMSMGLAHEEQIQSKVVVRKVGASTVDTRQGVMGLEKKYPIGGAVYFIGVLASTAIVQTHIFGICSTLIIAFFLNIKKFDILLNCGGYILLIYLIIIVVNFFCSHIIGDHLLTQQGFRIRYPWLFFVFLFVFTIIHAVLGIFYALWRALLLFVTTIWVINRLDISLFQAGKRLDNGHYSFMSMLLLTHVIRLEKEARVREGDPSEPLEHASQSTAAALLSQRTLDA